MPHNTDRILTTHVGSLIRPPKLIEFWRPSRTASPTTRRRSRPALPNPSPRSCASRPKPASTSSATANSARAPTGPSTSTSGSAASPCGRRRPRKPRTRWPRWAAAATTRRFPNSMPNTTPPRGSANGSATVSSSTARSAIRTQTGRARHPKPQGRRRQERRHASVAGRLPAGRGAGKRAARRQDRALQGRRDFSVRARRCAAPGIQGDRRRRPLRADRRRVPALHARAHGAADVRTPIIGAGRRCASTRSITRSRHPGGALALSHLLGQLERPARLRRAAQGHHRSRAAGARRPLFIRGRQSAPRP